jgi:hypothetical protein
LAGHPRFSSLVAAPGHAGLIRVLPPGLFPRIAPATCANDVPVETVRDRSVPVACGPNVDHRPLPARVIAPPGAGCRSSVADQEIPAFV